MQHADNAGANSTHIRGERQECSTYDVMITGELSIDITQLNKSNLFVTFNDADSCYGRISPELCSIILRRDGCPPKSLASYHSKTITHMAYKILTAHGELIISIINTIQLSLGGTGQCSTGSRVLWYCHIDPLLAALTTFSPGFQFTDVINLI